MGFLLFGHNHVKIGGIQIRLCLVRISITLMKLYDQKQSGKESVYFSIYLSDHAPSPREVGTEMEGRNAEAGADGDHGGALLTALPLLGCSASFLIHLETPGLG